MESKTTISLTEFNTIYEGRYIIERLGGDVTYGKRYLIKYYVPKGQFMLIDNNMIELYPDTRFFVWNTDEFLSEDFVNDVKAVMKYLLVNNSKYMEKKEKRVRNEKVSL